MDKGTLSTIASGLLLGLGLALPPGKARDLALAAGLSAFSGGLISALAVKMLFDRVPGLAGSGVIPARSGEIRARIHELILGPSGSEARWRELFRQRGAEVDWKSYLKIRAGSKGPAAAFFEKHWDRLTSPQILQPIIEQQIEKLLDSQIGGLLSIVGVEAVKPAVKEFVTACTAALKEKVVGVASGAGVEGLEIEIDEEKAAGELARAVEVDLERRLLELDAGRVKAMLEAALRGRLGWLVVWGNALGGLLGALGFFIGRQPPA